MKSKALIYKIIIVISMLIVALMLTTMLFCLYIILPQLPEAFQGELKPSVLSTDEKTLNIYSEMQNSNAKQLWDKAAKYLKEDDFKTSLYIDKLFLKRIAGDKENVVAFAETYANMGDCYRNAFNTKAACAYADIALKLMPPKNSEADYYLTNYMAACAFADDNVIGGFKTSKKAVEQLKYVLTLEISSPEWEKNYSLMKKNTYEYLIQFYSLSPQVNDYREVIKYNKEQMQFDERRTGSYYSIAMAYLDMGDIEHANEYCKLVHKYSFATLNDLAASTYYCILTNDFFKAKIYIDLLGVLCITQNTKEAYYFTSTLYYQKTGDIPKAKEYLTKLKDNNNYKVYHQDFIKLEKELGMNFDDVRAQLAQKYEEYSKISLELGGKSWEDGLKEIS